MKIPKRYRLINIGMTAVWFTILLSAWVPLSWGQVIEPSVPADAQDPSVPQETEEEKQDRLVAERFLELLTKRPRPGTALDKVYGYHIQRGTLDKFCMDLHVGATSNARGESWLLLGLVELERGRDSEALMALQKAEELLPEDAMASYYHGKSLSLVGNASQAVEAMERAIQRKPTKTELLTVLQDLGRIYQRMGRSKEATEVWKNLEESFPGDARVKEQIASIVADEGATADALVRYEELVAITKDRFHKVELSLCTAQLKETLGRREEALADFEQLLGQVNPDSWMYQDLRSRIDRTFTSRNDYDGLANYYQRWIETHPEDIDAMLRIGRFLSMQKRTPEAKLWFSKAIERAPRNPAPRLALIDALEREQQYRLATEAMKSLVELEPDNVDHVVRLGSLIVADQAVAEAERARAAAEVWKRLLEKRGDDAITVARVADLLRGVKLVDESINAYRKAIELSDSEPQYREYLGEYLFRLDRKGEALAVWNDIASGPRETRDSLVRLSEVLASFHLDQEAIAIMARACADNPTFEQRIRYTKMLRGAKKYDDAIRQIDLATGMAESVDEQALVIEQQIETYAASGQLTTKIGELEASVAGADKDKPEAWQKLAAFLEADRRFTQAATAIARGIELSPQSSAMLTIQARVLDKANQPLEAIESLRKLAALDRRLRSNYLMQIAMLQMRVGQQRAAVATGQELISGTTANAEQLKFFADLCFQTGDEALGLEALRRNLRRNPNDRDALRSLALKLSVTGEDLEAIELLWRAYAVATTIEERRNDILALVSIYKRKDQVEQLFTRLNNLGQERGDQRELTLLMATARQTLGELTAARALLDSLITESSHDGEVLNTLIQLAAAETDWDAAVRYQRRLNDSAPSVEGEQRLAKFLFEKGDIDEALAIWTSQTQDASSSRLRQVVDVLLKNKQNEKAIEFAQKAFDEAPDNWEVVVAVMNAMWSANDAKRAEQIASRLLEMKLPFDTPATQYRQQVIASQVSSGSTSIANAGQAPLSSRTAWLGRFEANQSLIFYSQVQRTGFSSALTINTFGDAKLIAKFLRIVGRVSVRSEDGTIQLGAMRSATKRLQGKEIIESASSLTAEEIWELIAMQYCIADLYNNPTSENPPVSDDGAQEWLLNRLMELGDTEAPALLLQRRYFGRIAGDSAAFNSVLALGQSWNSWLYSSNFRSQPSVRSPIPRGSTVRSSSGESASTKLEPLSAGEIDRLVRLFEQTVANGGHLHEQITYLLWLAEENRRAGREESVPLLVKRAKELIEQNPSMIPLIAIIPFDREYAIKEFAETFNQRANSKALPPVNQRPNISNAQSNYSPYFIALFLSALLEGKPEPEELAALCSALKESQAASARNLTPTLISAYDPTRQVNLYAYRLSSGGSPFSVVPIKFPSNSALQSADLLSAFYYIQQKAKPELKDAVAKRLAEEAEAVDEDGVKNAVDRICYATWLWWEGKKEDAIKQMTEFRKLSVANEVGVLIESGMLLETDKIDEAIELLDSLSSTNPRLLEYRELTLMSVGIKHAKLERAKKAVERLYAMPLKSATQLRVSDAMEQLEMKDMSTAIIQRLRRSGASDLPTMFQLMTKLKKSEDHADKLAAYDLARKIYQRTQPKTLAATQLRQLGQQAGLEFRSRTVRVLVEAGDAEKLIKSLEERVAQTPKNEPLIHQLAELYRETGKEKLAEEILKPYMPEPVNLGSNPVQLTQEQIIERNLKSQIALVNEQLSKTGIELAERLKKELFQNTTEKQRPLINAKIISGILATDSTDSPDRRNAQGKLQQWLTRVSESTEGKEALKRFVKSLEPTGSAEIEIPQLVVLVCAAYAANDKETAARIAKSIVAHSGSAYSVAALATHGRETTWAAVPVALKLGDADLAVKLAQIALKPSSDPSLAALNLEFDFATLQLEVNRLPDAGQTLKSLLGKLNRPNEEEPQAKSALAMRIALFAADKSLIEVSCEAALRASVLSSTGPEKVNDDLLKLVQIWQSKQASPELIYNTIKEVVLRGNDPNRWRIYPEPRRNFGGSHDFTFPEIEPEPLALVLVDLAQANNSVSALIQDIDSFSQQPSLRLAMLAMKAYALRTLGRTSEAAKLIDESIDLPKTIPDEILLLYAFTTPILGSDVSTTIPQELLAPLLKRFINERIIHTGTRIAILSQMKECIFANDRVMLDNYVAAIEDAIPKLTDYDEQSLKLMLNQFYKYLAGECKAQRKTELSELYFKRVKP